MIKKLIIQKHTSQLEKRRTRKFGRNFFPKNKEKKGNSKIGSMSGSKGNLGYKSGKDSPKITSYSSHLTSTTPSNSIGTRNSNNKKL